MVVTPLIIALVLLAYFYHKLFIRCILAEEKLKSQQASEEAFEQLSYQNSLKAQQFLFEKSSEEGEKRERMLFEMFEKMRHQMHQLEQERKFEQGMLKEQLSSIVKSEKELRLETTKLSQALQSPKGKGRWGELQLRRVVELSGMMAHCDFKEQMRAQTEEGRKQPDLVVHLPGNRQIIVDAKVPLDAYLEASSELGEEGRIEKGKLHAKHLKDHIMSLSKKNYWHHFDAVPEFVVLFLPSESIFVTALEHGPLLMEIAAEHNIVLATPMTLIALLKAAAYGWKQENISHYAKKVSELGEELYKRVFDLSTHWNHLGKSLEGSIKAFNQATGSLEKNVLSSARKFHQLGAAKATKFIQEFEEIEAGTRSFYPQDNPNSSGEDVSS
ncbi:MAG: DNA recombination protein RmuC [Candidatus Rhabdochlamydia sp.]